MVRPYGESNSIHYFAYVGEDFLQHSVALHVVVKSLCLVPVDEGSGLGVIYCKALVDCLLVVVGTSLFLATVEKTYAK